MPTPSYLDLKAFLASHGVDVCNDLSKEDYVSAVAAAIGAWESATGWYPFVSPGPDTKTIDGPQGYNLFPDFGIISISTLQVHGQTLVEGTDFWLQHQKPGNGPYQSIEFRCYVDGTRRCVSMTGRFGFALDWSSDVRRAILAKAGYDEFLFLTSREGDVVREKQGPVEFEYAKNGDAQYVGKRGSLLKLFDDLACAPRYKRASL